MISKKQSIALTFSLMACFAQAQPAQNTTENLPKDVDLKVFVDDIINRPFVDDQQHTVDTNCENGMDFSQEIEPGKTALDLIFESVNAQSFDRETNKTPNIANGPRIERDTNAYTTVKRIFSCIENKSPQDIVEQEAVKLARYALRTNHYDMVEFVREYVERTTTAQWKAVYPHTALYLLNIFYKAEEVSSSSNGKIKRVVLADNENTIYVDSSYPNTVLNDEVATTLLSSFFKYLNHKPYEMDQELVNQLASDLGHLQEIGGKVNYQYLQLEDKGEL